MPGTGDPGSGTKDPVDDADATHLALSSSAVEFRRAAMDSAVTVTDLVVDRGKRKVLRGLSFAVPRGQVTGLLGPSGSGKTTLMRALVGVQQVRAGEVTVLGEPAGSPGLRARV